MSDLVAQMGGLAWTVASFVVALSIIVGIHEFGHYIVGRWSGIRAEVFSIGFGRPLWGRTDRNGTRWQIAAIPLGGYVRFLGDDNVASAGPGRAVDPALRRQTLEGAPLWARAATVSAGPVFNFILSTLVFAGLVMVQGFATDRPTVGALTEMPPGVISELRPGDEITAVGGHAVSDWRGLSRLADTLPPAPVQDWTVRREGRVLTVPGPDPMPARVSGVAPRSPARDAGLKPGDVVLGIDDHPIARFTELRPLVEAAGGRPVTLRLWRPGAGEVEVTLSARQQDLPVERGYEKRWLIGISGGDGYITPATRPAGLVESVQAGAEQTWRVVSGSLSGLWAVITRQISGCNVSGAITIAEVAGQAAAGGVQSFLWMIAVLSAGIGVLNILPIPMLDGGHLAFHAWEALTGRPPSERALRILTAAGLALVLTLMLFGLSNDIRCR